MVRAHGDPTTRAGLSGGKVGVAYLGFCALNTWLQLSISLFTFSIHMTNTEYLTSGIKSEGKSQNKASVPVHVVSHSAVWFAISSYRVFSTSCPMV